MSMFAAKMSPKPASSGLKKSLPWVEKYRPRRIRDIKHQDQIVKVLQSSLESRNVSHMLFYGPAGTGKTSAALALAHELFPSGVFKSRVLELNASDDRGIAVVRTRIKTFAQATAHDVHKGKGVPPFKIIILDESDNMTADAQAAMRRTMEVFVKNTRFILVCNYVSRIIEPIASRCAKFRFSPLPHDAVLGRLNEVCSGENINVPHDVLEGIVGHCGGDLRAAITSLQSMQRLYPEMGTLTTEAFFETAGIVPQSHIISLLKSLSSSSFSQVKAAVDAIVADGYGATQIIEEMSKLILQEPNISEKQKAQVLMIIGETDYRIVDGGDENVQLLSCAARVMRQLCLVGGAGE